ncbi:MAG: sulfatase [Planctomycetota bacterium]
MSAVASQNLNDNSTSPGATGGERGGTGLLKVAATSVAGAVFFAAGATATETVVALFAGSYVAAGIILAVLVWWVFAAAIAALIICIVLSPLIYFLKGKARLAVPAAVTMVCGLLPVWFAFRPNLSGKDALFSGVLLRGEFLAFWAIIIAGSFAVCATMSRRGSVVGLYVLSVAAVLLGAGLGHYVPGPVAALVFVGVPVLAAALTAALFERGPSRKARAAVLVGALVLYGAAFVSAAAWKGRLARPPIDSGFREEPGKIAMLAGKPNVIIVTLDTARADHMSVCGYRYPTTPYLEEFARECRFFPNGVTVDSWTLPAHASMFTGKYPRAHGAHAHESRKVVGTNRALLTALPLSPSQVSLATLLAAKGYHTAAFSSNYVWLAREFGLHRGFHYYRDSPRYLLFTRSGAPILRYGAKFVDRLFGLNNKFTQPYYGARSVTRSATRWLEANGGTPFFLFLNYMDPHEPYGPPPGFDDIQGRGLPADPAITDGALWVPFRENYISNGGEIDGAFMERVLNLYDGELAYADHWIGRLIESLREKGLYEDTLIVVMSDHGEFFGEHQLLNHGVGVYEGGLRIPILLKYPGGVHAGEVIEKRVSIIDIFATVLEVLRLPDPGSAAQPLGSVTHPVIAEDYLNGMNVRQYGERFDRNQMVIYSGDWKFIRRSDGTELYDLSEDPNETTDLSRNREDLVGELTLSLETWRASTPYFEASAEEAVSPSQEMLERLRSLGYMTGSPR